MEKWPECPHHGESAFPVIFHHCDGEESRSKDSPSWQNVAEGEVVKMYLSKLLAYGVQPDEIGIISPYHKQCVRLRNIVNGESVQVDVGTTELFQGRERRVIIISTVRSRQQTEVKNDMRFALGFLGSIKRTTVALSRARSFLIVVGNMSLLSNDHTWNTVIKMARERSCLRGAPFELSRAVYGERSEWSAAGRPTTGITQAEVQGSYGDAGAEMPWTDHM
jgi:helicase MOV-10